MSAHEITAPTVACDVCTGRLVYRVKFEDFPAETDNFDQLSDHRPVVFTSQQWLISVAEHREGKVTVWRLADADQGGDFAEDVVIAYAGPHPGRPGERVWILDLSGHGFYADLLDADGER